MSPVETQKQSKLNYHSTSSLARETFSTPLAGQEVILAESLCKSNKKKGTGETTLVVTDMAENPSSPPSSDVHQVKNLEVPRVHLLHVGLVIL